MLRPLCVLISVLTAYGQDYSWERLHTAQTPHELIQAVEDYVKHFPCKDCKDHFQDLVDTHPFPISNVATAEDARIWSWLTHNMVNMRLGKPWETFEIMYTY